MSQLQLASIFDLNFTSRPPIHFSNRSSTSRHVASAPSQALTIPQNLACGAFGRACQILAMFPMDTIKTRVQVSRASVSAISRLTTAVSAGGLYKGAVISLFGQLPYGMLTFGLYESLKTEFQKRLPHTPDWLQIISAAAIGDAVGSLWLTPSEVVKSKTQAGVFKTPAAAASSIARNGVGGFYQGYSAAIARDIPFRMIQFILYERARVWYSRRIAQKEGRDITSWENLILGAITGTLAATATTPLDVIRTRMMGQGVGSASAYKNAWHCLTSTVSKEGAGALLKGLGPRCVLVAPSCAIFFVAYEAAKSFFRKQHFTKRVARIRHLIKPSARLRSHRVARSPGHMLLSSRRPVLC